MKCSSEVDFRGASPTLQAMGGRRGVPEPPAVCALSLYPLQILLLAFLKLIDEGSHMVMLECPETVNTLLHEFLLWEPEPSPPVLTAPPEKK